MKSLVVAFMACLGFVFGAGADQPNKKVKQENAGPVVNGLQLSLSADKTETVVSNDSKSVKPFILKLTFTNVSDKPVKFNAYDVNWSRIKGAVEASPADAMTLKRLAADRNISPPAAGDFFEIKPGQTWSPSNNLAFPGAFPQSVGSKVVYHVVKPGEFRVKFTYNSPTIDNPLAKDTWIGELVSNEVVIRIKADADEKK